MKFKVPAGLRDILPGSGSLSRDGLGEWVMVTVGGQGEDARPKFEGARTFQCPRGSTVLAISTTPATAATERPYLIMSLRSGPWPRRCLTQI